MNHSEKRNRRGKSFQIMRVLHAFDTVPSYVKSCYPVKACRRNCNRITTSNHIPWIMLEQSCNSSDIFRRTRGSSSARIALVTVKASPCNQIFPDVSQNCTFGRRIPNRKRYSKSVLYCGYTLCLGIIYYNKHPLLCGQL